MPRIGVIGSSNIDLVTQAPRMPAAGETLGATGFATGNGGKGANQAVAAARCGGDVLLVTRVGDDAFGVRLLADYAAEGIDTRHVRAVPGAATGTATILVEPSGENRILVAAGANAALTPADVDAAWPDLAGCALVVLQLETPLATVHHAIDVAAADGVDVLLNPAPAAAGLDTARLAKVALLVPNQTELALLSGRPTATRAEAGAAAGLLLARGPRTIVVTLGAAGALIVDADGSRHVPPPEVEACDTTGAGDAFIGALAERLVATGDLAGAVEAAVRYAADTITRPGAQASYATRADLERRQRGT